MVTAFVFQFDVVFDTLLIQKTQRIYVLHHVDETTNHNKSP